MSEQNLFTDNYIAAFNEGYAAKFILNRNKNLGALITSERGVFYIQILFRMLYFRKEHEIEPLNDEIYYAVKNAQELYSESEYSIDFFNRDIQQLFEWNIISRRIEKERLRGYKDIRRQKFRYTLNDETVSFLTWLEDSLHADIEDKTEDTRNFLTDLIGRLKETIRGLDRLGNEAYPDEEKKQQDAASIIYNINLLDELTFRISRQLGELNARLLSFLFTNYKLKDAKNAVAELDFYSTTYLKQVDKLRRDIIMYIRKVIPQEVGNDRAASLFPSLNVDNKNANRDLLEYTEPKTAAENLRLCIELATEYYEKLPFLSEKKLLRKPPLKIFDSLNDFYKTSGKLDSLCRRINDTAMRVWGKLSAYLRELERKNTRLEDIKSRMKEIAVSKEESALDDFFFELLAPAQMITDSNYWKEGFEKADPPLPRIINDKKLKEPKHFFVKKKKNTNVPVQTLEQVRLKKLKEWIQVKTNHNCNSEEIISKWHFNDFNDFSRILELAENGILNNGKKLEKINMKIEIKDNPVEIELKKAQLRFSDMVLKKKESR